MTGSGTALDTLDAGLEVDSGLLSGGPGRLGTGLLKRQPANRVAPFSLGVPVAGLAADMLVLGEGIPPWRWGGIALVVAAPVCVTLGGLMRR